MIKLNDDSIIVGQIKQLLHNFNLPRCYYGFEEYLNNNYLIEEGNLYYIKKNPNIKRLISPYSEGESYLNVTTKLDINSKYYDDYTHRYLGDYLRFLRDYHNINLMSMYNCNYNKLASDNLIFSQDNETQEIWDKEKNDIYIIPIDCFQNEFTISLTGSAEALLCLYDLKKDSLIKIDINENDKYALDKISLSSKVSIYCKDVSTPTLFTYSDKTADWGSLMKSQYKKYLSLAIKVTKGYSNPLVVLEGNFVNKGSSQLQINLNEEDIDTIENNYWKNLDLTKYITNPQLLSYDNNKNSYLLADRLIEYLTGNAITNISESYDIEKVQDWLSYNKNQLQENYNINVNVSNTFKGMWSKEMTYSLIQLYYYYLNNPKMNNIPYYDFVGYCDSNIEKILEQLGTFREYDYGGIL